MKKLLALLLVVLLGISMAACGGQNTSAEAPAAPDNITEEAPASPITEKPENTGEIAEEPETEAEDAQDGRVYFEPGKETAVENFVFTVNEIGFSDTICIEKGDRLGLGSKTGDAVAAKEGYGWLYFSVSYKFTGTEKLTAQGQFLVSAEYDGHYFMTPNLRFFKYDGAWHGLDYQGAPAVGLPLPATDMFYEYDPWVEKDYELHGAVQVAKKAVEDTETPLYFRLDFAMGGNETERVECMVEIEAPAEPTPDDRLLTFSYEDREFFKEYVAGLTPMTEEEILSVLSGSTFSMRNNYGGDNNGIHTITFFEDGSLDANYTYEGELYTMFESWTSKDGCIILTNSYTSTTGEQKTSEYLLTPYRYDDSRYLLMQMDRGDYSMVLTVE